MSYKLKDLWPEWQEDAHCKGVGTSYYFGDEASQPTMSIGQIRNASKLCDVCPVFQDCLRHALEWREEYGVWAGTSGRTRKRMFALLDDGTATIEEIVEAVSNERRGQQPPTALPVNRGTGVGTEEAGTIAL